MESLERSKTVIALGKRLVASLRGEDDLSAEWMAHLIAERMEAVERASSNDRSVAEDACAEAIYRLWEHRFAAGGQVNPLHQAEPIARALASLDPDRKDFRFFSKPMRLVEVENDTVQSDWLKFALELDRASKELVHFALRRGTESALVSESFQAALAEALGANVDVDLEVRIVSFIVSSSNAEKSEALAKFEARRRWERAEKLQEFAALALDLAAELKSGLTEEPPDDDSEAIFGA